MGAEIDAFLAKPIEGEKAVAPAGTPFESWYSGQAEESKLDLAVKSGAATPPDTATRILKLQAKTGLPEDLIQRNLDSVEQESQKADFDPEKFRQSSPVMAAWMSESPNNAAAVRDNIDSVKEIEDSVKDFSFGQTMWRDFNSGLSTFNANLARVPGAVYDIASLPLNIFYKAIRKPEWQTQSPDIVLNNPVAKYYDRLAESFKTKELDESIVGHIKTGDYARAGRVLAAQFMANAPNQAAIIGATLLGAGAPALAGMGLQQAAATDKQARESGADPTQVALDAALQGSIEAAFESIGTFGILKHWENKIAQTYGKQVSREVWKDFGKSMAATAVGEGNEEFLTQIAQDWSDYITGVNPTAMKGTIARALDAGIIGAASGAATTAPSATLSGIVRAREAQRAESAKKFYLALGESAESSVLREKLPEAQKELISRMTKDTPVENVYIPVEAMETYFQSADLNPTSAAQEIGILDEYTEAKETGADVKIPLATWADKVVGTKYYQSFADDIKFNPEDLTVNQHKQVTEFIKAEEAKQKEAAQAQAPVEDKTQAILDNVMAQLEATGMDKETARTTAAVFTGFRVLGERMGIDPTALYEKYGSRSSGRMSLWAGLGWNSKLSPMIRNFIQSKRA